MEGENMDLESCQICFEDEKPLLRFDCNVCLWCSDCTKEWLSKQPRKGHLLKTNFSCCNCRTWVRDTTGTIPREEVDYIQGIFKHVSGLLIESRGEQEIVSKNDVSSDFLVEYDFIICNSCEKPYFGGLHACNEVKFNDDIPNARLCAACLPDNLRANCEKHGPYFVTYKCYFCCSVAKLYQNGKLLCEGCGYARDKAVVKDCRSLTEQLHPKWLCDGKHSPNGQVTTYGCLLCTQKCASTPVLDPERNLKL